MMVWTSAGYAVSRGMVNTLLLLFLAFSAPLYAESVEERMKQLSVDERFCMKAFFKQAIVHDQAAHVLFFSNKPVCLTGPAIQHNDRSLQDILCLKGWRVFKRHEHLFPHPNFIFCEHIYDSGRECKVLDIYIINKRSLKKCLTEHLDAFKEGLGDAFSPEQFIAKLEEGRSLPELVNENQMLIGILLGYGEESSRTFKRACGQPHTETYRRIDLQRPQGCKIHPVVFMGNPRSEEVRKLSSTYEKELQAIWSRYKSEDPLKLFLDSICNSP